MGQTISIPPSTSINACHLLNTWAFTSLTTFYLMLRSMPVLSRLLTSLRHQHPFIWKFRMDNKCSTRAFHMRCLRRIFGLIFNNKVTNFDVSAGQHHSLSLQCSAYDTIGGLDMHIAMSPTKGSVVRSTRTWQTSVSLPLC